MSHQNAIQTTHNLDFYSVEWHVPEWAKSLLDSFPDADKYPQIEWKLFKVGTCEGQFRVTPEAYEILSVINESPGNGHFDDVLQWFEYACKRSRLPLRIIAFTNEGFKKHLIAKRGFVAFGNDVEKTFR